ncbi:zinc protease [Pasteurella testudinis DSM 23072]|uniref:Zinc protease n=1 Tax=Pasteurella testudinis DSM 23072 TaxID=1122938 RepID=A0A1W1UFC6_9PAST|nr:insulinase family protein [Pasteurella testudinis]SMB79511.1 zinc protease [Pasteurella testudinis DSM 23072]SUB50742.1 PqqL [Pasteurella testudinis]
MRLLFTLFLCLISTFSFAEVSEPLFGRLQNGLRYTLLPLHSEPGHIEIRVKVYAGAVDENDDQAGVAHMLEHLVFRQSEQFPSVMNFLHEHHWVRGRNYNAVTTNDSTTYLFTPPDGNLQQALTALSQMLFHAKLTQADLDDERKIILEEWRAGQGVGARMARLRTESVRVDSRYTRAPVIGTPHSIESMPAGQLQAFYRTWYAPNNMQLLIVGDLEPQATEKLIQTYFGKAESKTVPPRDYLEPKLSDILRTTQLQDAQSAVSQIAYIVRFDESDMREQTEAARYQRWLDRLALAVVTQRFRNQSETLPQGVNSIVLRKSDIGQKTVALGVFSSVAADAHRAGLAQIFSEMERLKRYPITQEELNAQKAKYQAQIDHAKQHKNDRDFRGWVQAMVDSVLVDKSYLTQPEIAALSEPMLQRITLEEVNRHIQNWFGATDRIVQYQAPRLSKIEPIDADWVRQLQAEIEQSAVAAPQQEKVIEPMALDKLEQSGSIVSEQVFAAQNVIHWSLSNGDKVVWLKTPLAQDRTWFQSQSSAGFQGEGLGRWQSQFATQLVLQNAPLDWEAAQLERWKSVNKVNLSAKQSEQYLTFSAQVENSKIADMLRLFYAYQQETAIKEGLDESKESTRRSLDMQAQQSTEHLRLSALSRLRFGSDDPAVLPQKDALDSLSPQDLDQVWRKMVSAPTTYFFVNDLAKQEMQQWVTTYLAGIPRRQALPSTRILPTEGKQRAAFAMNLAPKEDVKIWYFTPYQWQGKDAVLVSLLQNIATQKLKLSLRDEHLGVYSLRFESKLNPETHRIESELSFTANPAMTDSLITLANQVLQALPAQISEEDVKLAKSQFLKAEKERLKRVDTWLNRLVLSENQFANPQYLSDMQQLGVEIDLPKIKAMAANLYSEQNQKVFVTTQKNNDKE